MRRRFKHFWSISLMEPRDVNDRSNTGAGTTLLMAATMFLDSFAKLDFVQVTGEVI